MQRDESEFARLSNLGDVLGLTPMDINAVHTGLAEQAFRHQVQMVSPALELEEYSTFSADEEKPELLGAGYLRRRNEGLPLHVCH